MTEYEDNNGNKPVVNEYEAYIDRKLSNILGRLKIIEDRVSYIESELRSNDRKKLV